ncbi:MAG: TRAP transporter large permease subunit, partial [Hylemonella sp.]|nr:TRAP transporter large permease subunit [Hylemonella sp.]
RTVAMGAITASGTLAQAIPPSLVLIVLADQLGRSVGDMYAGALVPGLLLVACYILFVVLVALFRPSMVPALPPEARIYHEPNGKSGHRSLGVLFLICFTTGYGWSQVHDPLMTAWLDRSLPSPTDEIVILSMTIASLTGLFLAIGNHVTKLGLLSRLAEQVTFVLMPPLILIFLVLGTIFLGVATPTEGGAMGALGALILAAIKRRFNVAMLTQALDNTAKLATFVMFILIGSTVFSFTFNAADGHVWVEHLFDKVPGGVLGFLIVVNLLVFILGMFIDFFEIAFIVIPLLAPVAEKMGIDLIWFGVLLAMNMQTSFLTPPFGFALFYLRSVAPKQDYNDRVTGKLIPAVTTSQIYKGSIAFIAIQIFMVSMIITYPELVSGNISKVKKMDMSDVMLQLQEISTSDDGAMPDADLMEGLGQEGSDAASDELTPEEPADAPATNLADEDPMKALLNAMEKDKKK